MVFGQMTVVSIFFPILLLCGVILIAVMLVSLARESDERRRLIVTKASAATFYITLGILAADVLKSAAAVFIDGMSTAGSIPSFPLLSLMALVFSIALAAYRKKFGG